jgi:hypothetical protein
METTFETDGDPVLDELRRDVAKHRNASRLHIEFRRLNPPVASAHAVATAFVRGLAMHPPKGWTELDAQGALEVATRVLHADLAYNVPVMTFDLAKELARRFLACCGEGATFVTNGSLAQSSEGDQWSPLTGATFDTGVIAVSSRRVSLLWVEDED